ncbi:UNVERIFIED_CONTAM: hypothetical protein GTU68_014048, partial [Idotea baltica]|nr:hypothetical protein [Idotea baltica]
MTKVRRAPLRSPIPPNGKSAARKVSQLSSTMPSTASMAKTAKCLPVAEPKPSPTRKFQTP